ncbi:MAG: hypothetical protein Q9166_005159 [cf. Caloplaca sp. 2 TL-2023]
MLTLVFALSVSARCVKRLDVNKQSPVLGKQSAPVIRKQAGSVVNKQAVSQTGSEDLSFTPSNNSSLTPVGSENQDGQSKGRQAASTTSRASSSTTDSAAGGSEQTPSPSSSSSASSSPSPSADAGNTSSNGSGDTTSSGSDGTSNIKTTPTTSGRGSGGCGKMKGVCFNGGMQPSMYDKMTSASDWITFGLDIPGGPASSRAQQDHIPMMAFATHVPDAVKLVNGPNAPEWLLTFNEPDYSYMGWTPTMTGKEAADAIKDLLASPGTKTKFVAPATADPDNHFLEEFFEHCKCKDFFSAYNMHQYHPTSAEVIKNVQDYHNKWNDKPLWLTEVAPGGANCGMSWEESGKFMKEIYQFAGKSGFLEKVFWNTGNQIDAKDTNVCNSWLVDGSGNPGPLLPMFEAVDCT